MAAFKLHIVAALVMVISLSSWAAHHLFQASQPTIPPLPKPTLPPPPAVSNLPMATATAYHTSAAVANHRAHHP